MANMFAVYWFGAGNNESHLFGDCQLKGMLTCKAK